MDFLMILKDEANDIQIVTAFCVDKNKKLTYYQ